MDEKIHRLEQELLALKTSNSRERYVILFLLNVAVVATVGTFSPGYVFLFLIAATIILQIGLANWLNFPWVIQPLTRWLKILERWMEKKLGTRDTSDTE